MGEYTSNKLPLELLDDFRAAGFVDSTYENQVGVFLKKVLACSDMPNVKATIVNGEYITDDSKCVVEIVPDGDLQLYIDDDDYHERYNFFENKEGFLALAKDAGVELRGIVY